LPYGLLGSWCRVGVCTGASSDHVCNPRGADALRLMGTVRIIIPCVLAYTYYTRDDGPRRGIHVADWRSKGREGIALRSTALNLNSLLITKNNCIDRNHLSADRRSLPRTQFAHIPFASSLRLMSEDRG
jgi:hypothetical protein